MKIFTTDELKIVSTKFEEEISGYHLINDNPIKESLWEEINCNIVSDTCKVDYSGNSNHKSGIDTQFNNYKISNKTAKVLKNGKISISSYRLTSVCSDKNIGNSQDIINEIKNRDNNFDYYSILLRKEEKDTKYITYIWCMIPKSLNIFNMDAKNLEIKYGKNKKKVGWKSKYYDITFSMSSQLWFHFHIDDITKFIINQKTINNNRKKLRYSDIYELFCEAPVCVS